MSGAMRSTDEVMAEVQRQADRWRHIHEWFHERRMNPRCPVCPPVPSTAEAS